MTKEDAMGKGKQGKGIDRRTFVGAAAVAGVNVALFGLAGCAPRGEEQKASFTPGTYTGQADGKFDFIKVEAVFSEDAITDVRVVESNETERIAQPAIDQIPGRIVEAQGLDVDAVSGATLTSMGIVNAAAECVEQAGGDVSKLRKAGASIPRDDTEELVADVVVVGAGASGMGAAVACAQKGARVVVLEKNSFIGGNCLVASGYLEYLTAPDEARHEMTPDLHRYVREVLDSDIASASTPEIVQIVRDQYEEFQASGGMKLFDSQEFYALDYAVTAGEGMPVEAYLPVAQSISELNVWMTETGFDWRTPTEFITGYLYPRWSHPATGVGGEGYFDFFGEVMDKQDLDVEILLSTAVQELIVEDGSVVGVCAVAEDGAGCVVRAEKVLLASGGFSGNPDLLREFNTMWPYPEGPIPTTNVNGHTGDGIRMAREAGARLSDMDNQMIFPFNDPLTMSGENVAGTFADSPIVNKLGKRFLDETADRYSMTEALMEQPDSLCYFISDSGNIQILETSSGEETLLRRGQLYKSDTLEDLARQIGLDPEALVEEMKRFNGFVEAGEDEDFGRYLFSEVSAVDTPPFYAAPATWANHITLGGVDTDESYRVVDEGGDVVPGLYACGEVRSGICGVSSIADGFSASKAMFG